MWPLAENRYDGDGFSGIIFGTFKVSRVSDVDGLCVYPFRT